MKPLAARNPRQAHPFVRSFLIVVVANPRGPGVCPVSPPLTPSCPIYGVVKSDLGAPTLGSVVSMADLRPSGGVPVVVSALPTRTFQSSLSHLSPMFTFVFIGFNAFIPFFLSLTRSKAGLLLWVTLFELLPYFNFLSFSSPEAWSFFRSFSNIEYSPHTPPFFNPSTTSVPYVEKKQRLSNISSIT